jgi:hypothetical protein
VLEATAGLRFGAAGKEPAKAKGFGGFRVRGELLRAAPFLLCRRGERPDLWFEWPDSVFHAALGNRSLSSAVITANPCGMRCAVMVERVGCAPRFEGPAGRGCFADPAGRRWWSEVGDSKPQPGRAIPAPA